jgi:hypothetical protein
MPPKASSASTDGTDTTQPDEIAAPPTPDAAPPAPPVADPPPAPDAPAPPAAPTPPDAAPLTPPKQAAKSQTPPAAAGAANAVVSVQAPGEHLGIVDHDGNPLGPDALFQDEGDHFTWVTAVRRIYQHFRYAGIHKEGAAPGRRLLYPAGAKVPRNEAAQVRDLAGQGAAAPEPQQENPEQ